MIWMTLTPRRIEYLCAILTGDRSCSTRSEIYQCPDYKLDTEVLMSKRHIIIDIIRYVVIRLIGGYIVRLIERCIE